MDALPFVDVHTVQTRASRDHVWAALVRTLRRTMGGSGAFARVLGCEPARSSDDFDGSVGQTLPGFQVVKSEPGHRMTLEGRHRFSRYRLTVQIDATEISARTEAAFPGVRGRLYRAAVISSGGHRVITRRMLRDIARA
jgi:hypothetical protein